VWTAFGRAIDSVKALSTSDVGAGEKASALAALTIGRLKYFWGVPVFPGEPDSLSAALLQKEIDVMDMRLYLNPKDATVAAAREVAFGLMWECFHQQAETIFTKADNVDEYIASVEALNNPILPDTGKVDYQSIKLRLPLLDYIMRWDEVKQTGRTYRGHCPIHADSNPSMVIYPDDGIGGKWWCYVCNEGGDVIDYERARLKNEKVLPE